MLNKTTTTKVCTTVVLFFILLTAYGQEKANINLIKSEFKRFPKSIRRDTNFKKAYMYFLDKEFDSTIVYSYIFLSSHKSNDVHSNYCHYFRGVSFKEKKLYSEARKEFRLIPHSFLLYYSSKMKLAEIALEMEAYSEALEYLLEIKSLPYQDVQQFRKEIIYHDIGLCYLHLEKFKESEEYLLESLSILEKKKDTTKLVRFYMNVANLYYLQYKDDQAIPFFKKAYSLSKMVEDFRIKSDAALNMAAVEENRQNYKQSIKYRKEYEQWKDSINDQNKIWAVAQLEKKFITEKKQKEIVLLEKDNSIKKVQINSFIYSSILLLLLVVTVLYFYLSKRKANKLILAQKVTLDALNDTKDRLFSVVSHDLRSNVNALDKKNAELSASFELKKYADLGPQLQQHNAITGSIKGLLDNMLNWALLQTEQMYFHRENLNSTAIVDQVTHNYKPLLNSKNITLKINIPPNVFVYADIESLKIVLRNVLDNAIKFSDSGDEISIYSKIQSRKYCQLIIEDTGSGMSESIMSKLLSETKPQSNTVNQERTGLGLHLCRAMLIKNGGALNIESEENVGTKVIISIPLSKDYE